MEGDDAENTPPPSEAVLDAVAEREGVQAEELTPRLYEVIDPEALDRLFRGTTCRVSFEYREYVVTVDYSGNVRVQPAESD